MATGTIILPVVGAVGDPTNPPGMAFTAGNRPYLAFDSATDELCNWVFRLPVDYSSGLLPRLQYSAAVNSGTFMAAIDIMQIADGGDVDTDAWGTPDASAATTVPGTVGLMDEITWTLTNGVSGLTAGEYTSVRLFRDISGDSAAGDVYVWALSLEYTTT